MNRKILFLINGLGLGNSTRCLAIIEKLIEKKCEVSVVTSGNGKWFFQNHNLISNLETIEEIKYGAKNNKINIIETLKGSASIYKTIRKNSNKIFQFINNYKPATIVTDSVYLSPKIKKLNIPIIAINNADIVIEKFKNITRKPKSIYMQLYFVEQLDYLYHRLIPNIVISPDLIFEKSQSDIKKIKRIMPIVRSGLEKNENSKPLKGGIMLSGSNFGIKVNLKNQYEDINLSVIGRSEPSEWNQKKNIKFFGKVKNNIDLLNNIDFCVVNGGYSAISELFWAKIPMIVVPVPNHAEQWVNAKQIENSGCGLIANEDNYEDKIKILINNFESFKKNFQKYSNNKNGAEEAANIIINC